MPSELLQPLLIGIMVTAAVFIGLRWALGENARPLRRALGVFAGACGLLTTFWLLENPHALSEYSAQIVAAGVAVVLALLAFARKSFK